MTTFNTTNADKILKVRYREGVVKAAFAHAKTLALFPRDEKFGGKNYQYTIRYSTSAGMSPVFATAQRLKKPGNYEQFTATRKKLYSLGSIENELIFASENDDDSLLRGMEECVDQCLQTFGRRFTRYLFGDGSGVVGRISATSNVATNEITLTNKWDHIVFQKGDKLQLSATSGGTLRTGEVTINSVTRVSAGVSKIKVDEASWAAGIPAAAASDYIYFSDASGNVPIGLLGHIPASDPTAGDSFRGVDRSVDPIMLAGIRYDGSTRPIEEAMTDAIYTASSFGGEPDLFLMHSMKMSELAKAVGSKEVVDVREDMPKLGFKAMSFNGPLGPVKVVGTPFCDYDAAYGLNMKTWRIKTAGQCPRFLSRMSGNDQWITESNDDALELRLGMYGDVICDNPQKNIRVALSNA